MFDRNINLKLSKNIFTPKFFPLLFDYSHRWECYMGSAGSAKSYFITQKLIIRACTETIRILVCRRTGVTMRSSCFSLFKDILKKFKIIEYVSIRETDMRISFPNGSEILFTGLDEETKLLSLNNISCVFIEEAYEVPYEIVEQLNLRLRGKAKSQQIFMAWNPISKNHWLYRFCEENPPESFAYIHSTYKDNPFLNEAYVKSLEELYTRNPQKARIFCDGKWGADSEGLVFKNFSTGQLDRMELAKHFEKRCACDLGMTDPTCIVETFFDDKNHVIYVTQEFCKTGQTLDEIYDALVKMEMTKCRIYFDNNEPRVIDFMRKKGINAKPVLKGAGSVEARILFLQNHKIVIDERCTKTIESFENYSYVKSKKTNEWTDDTTHEWSHIPDACGYAYNDIYSKRKLKMLDKAILGL